MKKALLVFCFLGLQLAYAGDEMPLIPVQSNVNIIYSENDSNLINTDKMKNKERVEKAKNQAAKKSSARVQLDKREITHERAIDYINQQNNAMLPSF